MLVFLLEVEVIGLVEGLGMGHKETEESEIILRILAWVTWCCAH